MTRKAPAGGPDDDGLRSLDAAFELPDVVTDPKLRALYEVLVARMRDEAAHLPMTTIQQLLIERIAFNYIVLRAKERGELGGFSHANIQKDYNTFWLQMTAEFNKLLGKSGEPLGNLEKKALFKEMQQLIVKTIAETVQDPRARQAVLTGLADAFSKAGM